MDTGAVCLVCAPDAPRFISTLIRTLSSCARAAAPPPSLWSLSGLIKLTASSLCLSFHPLQFQRLPQMPDDDVHSPPLASPEVTSSAPDLFEASPRSPERRSRTLEIPRMYARQQLSQVQVVLGGSLDKLVHCCVFCVLQNHTAS